MTRPTVLVTRKLPQAVEERLIKDYQPLLNKEDRPLATEQLLSDSKKADALIITGQNHLSEETIAQLPERLKAIATFSVGYDHIDLEAAEKRGFAVINTPGVLTDATADVTWLLLLAAARRAHEGEQLIRQGKWSDPRPTQLLGTEVTGKRLGILGMGRIGRAVAKRAKAFDMEVHYCNRHRLSSEQEAGAIFHDTPEDLLGVSDFLSFHCPATPETENFLNARRIELLPDGAIIVNAARGSLIVDEDLIAALRSRRIFAAGLDVFEGEPNLNPTYRSLPNVFLLPHLGSATVETRTQMGFLILDNLDAVFAGKQPPNNLVS
ncbi:D-glycerate dehydrogenase [Myxosarcina sp. GI1]|uniref:2-hydroxyacid dehydrogenase n=1 Tax=Myxosarcina sp. GI1 TaxID=1541065 RepID=UPI0005699F50|nr:D-glycerate dehydrogenase [Myxosarcina sp. GI1]